MLLLASPWAPKLAMACCAAAGFAAANAAAYTERNDPHSRPIYEGNAVLSVLQRNQDLFEKKTHTHTKARDRQSNKAPAWPCRGWRRRQPWRRLRGRSTTRGPAPAAPRQLAIERRNIGEKSRSTQPWRYFSRFDATGTSARNRPGLNPATAGPQQAAAAGTRALVAAAQRLWPQRPRRVRAG